MESRKQNINRDTLDIYTSDDASVVHASLADSDELREIFSCRKDVILDPDIYMWNLSADVDMSTRARHASQVWTPIDTPPIRQFSDDRVYWMREGLIPAIEKSWPPATKGIEPFIVESCLQWQHDVRVKKLVAPAPFLSCGEDDLAQYLIWLEAAYRKRKLFREPLLMTVAFTDVCSRELSRYLPVMLAAYSFDGYYLVTPGKNRSESVEDTVLKIMDLGLRQGIQVIVGRIPLPTLCNQKRGEMQGCQA